jgi:hypothetical protein
MASRSNVDFGFFVVEGVLASREDCHSLDLQYLSRQSNGPNGWWKLVEDL